MISHNRTPKMAIRAVKHLGRDGRLAVYDLYDALDDIAFQPLRGRRATERGLACLMELPATRRKLSEAVLAALVDDGLARVDGAGEERVITVYRAEALYLDPATRMPTTAPPEPITAAPGPAPRPAPEPRQPEAANDAPSPEAIQTPAPGPAPHPAPRPAPGPIYARAQPTTSTPSLKTSSSSPHALCAALLSRLAKDAVQPPCAAYPSSWSDHRSAGRCSIDSS